MQLSCQEPKMKMYISSLVMGRMEKKERALYRNSQNIGVLSALVWLQSQTKGPWWLQWTRAHPSQTQYNWELPGFYQHLRAPSCPWYLVLCSGVVLLTQGALFSLLLEPKWCNPTATARQGKGQFSWWSQSCPRKTHYNNNSGISRGETVRAEWKMLSQRGWEMLLQLRGKGMELQGKGCGIADGCLWHHTWEGA